MRKAYLADMSSLRAHEAQVIDDKLMYSGWEFRSQQGIILNDSERIHLVRDIRERYGFSDPQAQESGPSDTIFASGRSLHLPPMVFKSLLHVANGGFQIEVKASDAIKCWAAQHLPSRIQNLKVHKVLFSTEWSQDNSHDIITAESSQGEVSTNEWDWTYSTDYICTISNNAKESEEIVNVDAFKNNYDSTWVAHGAPSRIDFALLSRKEEILFFDDVLLYQDDLDDCGEVQFSAKIRVMPSCWFILCRY